MFAIGVGFVGKLVRARWAIRTLSGGMCGKSGGVLVFAEGRAAGAPAANEDSAYYLCWLIFTSALKQIEILLAFPSETHFQTVADTDNAAVRAQLQ